MNAIESRDLTKGFGTVQAVSGISFTLGAGEMLALLGPSGSGKTTLLRLVAGLERPDAGTISLFGQEGLPPEDRGVGMVFQDLALWPHMRMARHLDFVLRGRGLPRQDRRERISQLLDLVQLDDRRRAFPNQLSGGQAQRLAIARTLATEPRILLLDEPFANLDHALRERIMVEVLRRKQEDGLTIILATHNHDEMLALADHTITMACGGRIGNEG
jgi:ABC-type Fe3+/spermidine/putrescine transport system ATPase subunit